MPIFLSVQKGPPGLLNNRFMMPRAHSTIGTGRTADIMFPPETRIAPLHAEISLDGRDMIIDSLEMNPVSVNGSKAAKHRIKLNASFMLGEVLELRFEHVPSQKGGQDAPSLILPAVKDAIVQADVSVKLEKLPAPLPTTVAVPAAAPKPEVKTDPKADAKPAAAKPAAPAAEKKADAKPAAAPAKKEPPRAIAEVELLYGEPITLDELTKISIFQGLAANTLAKLPGSVVKRTFKKGEIVCREGEYGFTAFYILEGTCDVYLAAPMAHVKSFKDERPSGFFGVLRDFKHRLMGKSDDPRKDANVADSRFVPIDGPEDLPLSNPIGHMKVGDLFGEMSCTSLYPRSATVRATQDCVMLEMLNNVLLAMKENPSYKAKYEKDYRERALGQHLRSVNILSGLDDKFIDQLRDRVELLTFKKGEVIVKEGDAADSFYLIRIGNIKVSKHYPGGDIVINYLGRGEFFGEMGLLRGGTRSATCSALDRVECVRIRKSDFDFMLSWYDDVREKLEQIAAERERAAKSKTESIPSLHLDEMLGQGLMQAQNLLLLDLTSCTRCDECVRACADSHDGVTRLVREGLRFDKFLVATSCRSCMDPVCMPGCPVGSIHRQESMEIVIEDWCIGCGLCAKNCPYGNINMHSFLDDTAEPAPKPEAVKAEAAAKPAEAAKPEAKVEVKAEGKAEVKKAAMKERKKAVTCDLCSDLKEPSCVYACPHDAAHRVDARKFFATGGDVKRSEV